MENKDILLEKLNNLNCNKYDISISKGVDYSYLPSKIGEPLKTLTCISIISDNFTASISSNNRSRFTIFNKDNVFESQNYSTECEGLFEEAYNILKPLLIFDV